MADSNLGAVRVSGFAGGRAVRRGERASERASALRQPCLRVYKLGSALGIFLLGQNWFFQPPPERSTLPRSLPSIDPCSSILAATRRSSLFFPLSLPLFLSPHSSFSSLFPDPEHFHLRPPCHVLFVSFARPRTRGMMGDLPGAGAPVREKGRNTRQGRTRYGGGMLMAALKSRYFRHRCYRCFLHSVSSVTINEVTDQSSAGVVAMAFLLGERGCCYGGDFARPQLG